MEVLRLDLASELRLRRWARLNYVSPDRRPASWHPIVLAEMSCRDEELAALADPTLSGSAIRAACANASDRSCRRAPNPVATDELGMRPIAHKSVFWVSGGRMHSGSSLRALFTRLLTGRKHILALG